MTEHKELDEYTFQDLDNYCFGSGTTYYIKHEVVRVIDAYENRIKELEANEQVLNDAHCKLMDKLEEKDKRIKELEERIKTNID